MHVDINEISNSGRRRKKHKIYTIFIRDELTLNGDIAIEYMHDIKRIILKAKFM